MQTFLPYPDFNVSAKILDYRRLGKQRVEAYQILNVLERRKAIQKGDKNVPKGWINHPAVLMWEGYEDALTKYYNVVVDTWILKGYKNNMPRFIIADVIHLPHWLGDENFHASHRSNLLRKDFSFYSQYDWTEPNNLPYIWPVNYAQSLSNSTYNNKQ